VNSSMANDIATPRRRSELSEDKRRSVVRTLAASAARLQSSHVLTTKCNLEKSQSLCCILLLFKVLIDEFNVENYRKVISVDFLARLVVNFNATSQLGRCTSPIYGIHSFVNIQQEVQLMLTNLRDAFGGQSRSPNIVPFHMLGIVFYCAIVTVFKTRRFYDIRLQKMS